MLNMYGEIWLHLCTFHFKTKEIRNPNIQNVKYRKQRERLPRSLLLQYVHWILQIFHYKLHFDYQEFIGRMDIITTYRGMNNLVQFPYLFGPESFCHLVARRAAVS